MHEGSKAMVAGRFSTWDGFAWQPDSIDLKDWDKIDDGWYFQVIGDKEVHIASDADLGFEVSVKREGLNIKTPSYYADFEAAYWAAVKEVRLA